jgi:hypothetical protein
MNRLGLIPLAVAFCAMAPAAQALVFTGSYSVNHYTDGSAGLATTVVDQTPGPGTGFSFSLDAVGDTFSFEPFRIYSPEVAVDDDDLEAKLLILGFMFTGPSPFGGALMGATRGHFTGDDGQNASLLWDAGGNAFIPFGVGGLLSVHVNDVFFNNGVGGLGGGEGGGASPTIFFTLQRGLEGTTAIPEPSTWALMILGFGFTGAMLRRRPVLA